MSARTNPLPRSLTLWYGLGAVPGGIAATAGVFLVFFYNQVLGVPGSQIGLVLFAIALFDAQGLSMALLVAAALFFIRGYGIDRVRHERVRAELDARTHSR